MVDLIYASCPVPSYGTAASILLPLVFNGNKILFDLSTGRTRPFFKKAYVGREEDMLILVCNPKTDDEKQDLEEAFEQCISGFDHFPGADGDLVYVFKTNVHGNTNRLKPADFAAYRKGQWSYFARYWKEITIFHQPAGWFSNEEDRALFGAIDEYDFVYNNIHIVLNPHEPQFYSIQIHALQIDPGDPNFAPDELWPIPTDEI